MTALRRVTLGMVIRDSTVKYIGERRTKALSPRSELESLRFRSSLFNIFFEPRMSAFQDKLYKTFLAMSVEQLLESLKVMFVVCHLGNISIYE
jgi:hypothetical protein